MFKCELCDKEFKYCSTLSNHISYHHKQITKEEYYKQYIMKSTDSNGTCPVCGKNTKFLGLSCGYRTHCSKKCSTLDLKVQNKKNNTLITKYGTTNIYERDDVKEQALKKRKQTTKDRFGVENVFQLENVRQKAQKNSHTKDALEKQKQTNLIKYGVKTIFQSEEVRQKMCQNNYTPEVIEKRKQTNLKKYGVENVFQRPDVRKNALSEKSMQKIIDTKRKNGTFNTSKPEDDVYNGLVNIFGKDNIKRNYKSNVYPFLCDFYVISLNLYIECNFSWTHGGHWYNSNDNITIWKNKAKDSKYYQNAINVWTTRDVCKRSTAKQHNLNYVVFWSYQDFLTWISLNCPIGHDWDVEYSWLPKRKLTNQIQINKLSEGSQLCSKLAKFIQFEEFYKRELCMWSDNLFEKCGTLQSNLYNNRLQYIGKNPNQLTDLEIIRGLNISGKIKAYTVFDNSGMKIFLDKYKPNSLYDPCAGWGERLITCAYRDIKYFGIDINQNVVNNHQKLIKMFNLDNQTVIYADSSNYKLKDNYDVTFTCPPYWNTEIYTNVGAENLSYDEFLSWWKNVILCSNSNIFAYQINQKYKTDMNNVLLSLGYSFIEEIVLPKKSSHFTNYNNRYKSEYESIQIFTRAI